jgi:hypothetical protein
VAHGTINLPFGNGTYDFNAAKHKQLFELQDKCGLLAQGADGEQIRIPCGPAEIFDRLRSNRWREADVAEPIRLGLIGGGLPIGDVGKLMAEFVHDHPLGTLAPLAARIMFAAVYGVQGDDLGKAEAERTASGVESSTSSAPPNTAPAARSGSRRGRSTKSPPGS